MLSLHKIAKKYSPLLAIFPRVAQPVAAAAVSKNSEQRVKLLFLLSNTSSRQPSPAQPSPAQPGQALLWPLWFIFNDYLPTKGSSRQLHQIALLPTFRKMNKNELKRLIYVDCLYILYLCPFTVYLYSAMHFTMHFSGSRPDDTLVSEVTVLAWLVLCVRAQCKLCVEVCSNDDDRCG